MLANLEYGLRHKEVAGDMLAAMAQLLEQHKKAKQVNE